MKKILIIINHTITGMVNTNYHSIWIPMVIIQVYGWVYECSPFFWDDEWKDLWMVNGMPHIWAYQVHVSTEISAAVGIQETTERYTLWWTNIAIENGHL